MTKRNGRWSEATQAAAAMAVIAGVLLLALLAFVLRFFKSLLW
ncbi:hypothetical protein ABZS81_04645 [Streptomyces sp. NPDC005318]